MESCFQNPYTVKRHCCIFNELWGKVSKASDTCPCSESSSGIRMSEMVCGDQLMCAEHRDILLWKFPPKL